MNKKRLSNLDYRKRFKIQSQLINEDFSIYELPSYKKLESFRNQYYISVSNREITTNLNSYAKAMILHNIFSNLFITHRKLTLLQCIFNAFYKEDPHMTRDEKKLFFTIYNELNVYSMCVDLYREYSSLIKELEMIKNFTSPTELFMKYISHVGACEGAIFLADNYSAISTHLTPTEMYYIKKMYTQWEKSRNPRN